MIEKKKRSEHSGLLWIAFQFGGGGGGVNLGVFNTAIYGKIVVLL